MINIHDWLYNLIYSKKDKEISNLNETIISLNNRIEGLLKDQNLIEPKSYGTINLKDTNDLLIKTFKCPVYLSDSFFNLTTKEEASKFSNETKVQYREWKQDNYDCDQFRFALMGYWSQGLISFAFGIAWSYNHAYNLMIDNDRNIWIVEPQTNKYYTLDEIKNNTKYYPVRMIIM